MATMETGWLLEMLMAHSSGGGGGGGGCAIFIVNRIVFSFCLSCSFKKTEKN